MFGKEKGVSDRRFGKRFYGHVVLCGKTKSVVFVCLHFSVRREKAFDWKCPAAGNVRLETFDWKRSRRALSERRVRSGETQSVSCVNRNTRVEQ